MIFHDIVPVAASRPKVTRYGTYYGKKYTQWRKDASLINLVVPDAAVLIFAMPIPKGLSAKKASRLDGTRHQKRPDLDNLVKAVLDAARDEDSTIHSLFATKIWSTRPGIWVGSASDADDLNWFLDVSWL